jgi:predicted transcriptional regulator
MLTMPTVPFSLRIDAEIKARLEDEARREDRSAAYVAQQAIRAYIETRERTRAAVHAAELEADKGVFISSAAMDAWVHSWGSENERPAPEPDIFPDKK